MSNLANGIIHPEVNRKQPYIVYRRSRMKRLNTGLGQGTFSIILVISTCKYSTNVEFRASTERSITKGGKRYFRKESKIFKKLTGQTGERVERPPIWVMRQGNKSNSWT